MSKRETEMRSSRKIFKIIAVDVCCTAVHHVTYNRTKSTSREMHAFLCGPSLSGNYILKDTVQVTTHSNGEIVVHLIL